MRLTLEQDDGPILHVACHGEISQLYTGGRDPFVELLGPECYRKTVILDLQHTTFIESSGIGWLVGCHTRFVKAGGRLVLHSLPPMLNDLLVKLVRLDRLLTIRENAASAQASLTEGGQP